MTEWGEALKGMRERAGLNQRELGALLLAAMPGENYDPDNDPKGNRAQQFVKVREAGATLRSRQRAAELAAAIASVFKTPVPLPPVDDQRGTRKGQRRGGDRQHEQREKCCPHCGGAL